MKDSVLTSEEIEEIRGLLLQEKSKIEAALVGMKSEAEALRTMDLKDEGDFAAASRDYNSDFQLRRQQRGELAMIDHALNKIAQGEFTGLCEMCGAEVTMQRYRVKPYARYCIECRTHLEKRRETAR